MASNDDAKRALLRIGEQSAGRRRKTGTIVSVQGRHASVLLDGEGTSIVLAYRGPYEPSIGAGVTIERVPETNSWRLAGIRDNALNVVGDLPYDFERAGVGLYYPLALEALNNAAYTLETGLTMTVYNTQFVNANGDFIYTASQSIDLADYVPVSDSRWCIVYADGTTGVLAVYAHSTTSSPDGEWPSAVNGLLDSDETAVPLLAVWLDADQAVWLDAHKVIKRGFSFAGKRIVSIPHAVQPIAGETGITSVTPLNMTGVTSGDTGTLVVVDDNSFAIVKNNYEGSAAPAVTDDDTAGYSVNSTWIDATTGYIYKATDVTTGAAVWVQIYPSVTDWANPSATIGSGTRKGFEGTYIDLNGTMYAPNIDGEFLSVGTNATISGALTVGDVLTSAHIQANTSLRVPTGVAPSADGQFAFANNRMQLYGRGMVQRIVTALPVARVAAITATTETFIHSPVIVLPANSVNIGTTIRVTAFGRIANTSGASRNLTTVARLQGVSILSKATAIPNGTNTSFIGEYTISLLSTGAAAFTAAALQLLLGSSVVPDIAVNADPTSPTVDTTAAMGVAIGMSWSGTGASVSIWGLTAEIIS